MNGQTCPFHVKHNLKSLKTRHVGWCGGAHLESQPPGKQRQDCKFKASLGNLARPCLKKIKRFGNVAQ